MSDDSKGNGETILVVDDNQLLLDYLVVASLGPTSM
jgi:hypothetical protein